MSVDARLRRHAHRAGRILLLAVVLLAFPFAAADDRVPDQIAAELAPGVAPETIGQRYGLTVVEGIPQWALWVFLAPAGSDIDQIVADMLLDPQVLDAEPHRNLENPEGGQRTIGDLDRSASILDFRNQPSAQTVKTAPAHVSGQGAGVIVAVLDTGMTHLHPATSAQIALGLGADFANGDGSTAVQPNGIDDDVDGQTDEMLHHGSLVAGVVNLAAPQARILPIRVLDAEGRGRALWVARGILHAIRNGADVINLSLGLVEKSGLIDRALREAKRAGVAVVAAAGNRAQLGLDFPARDSKTIAVAAVDENRLVTPFTSYGHDVDINAPGDHVLSTFGDVDYARWDGTSFAAPFVSGAAALIVERYPGLSPDEILDILAATAQPDINGGDWTDWLGAGTIDLEAAVGELTSDQTSLKAFEHPLGTELHWTEVLDATVYDLARGDVSQLHSIDAFTVGLGPVTCLAEDTTSTDNTAGRDPTLPLPGEAFFYVFRDDTSSLDGISYGKDSESRDRVATGADCLAGTAP